MRVLLVALASLLIASSAVAQTGVGGPPPQPRTPPRGQDSPPNTPSQTASQQAPLGAVTCRIGHIAVYANRVHVHCSTLGLALESAMSQMPGGSGQPPPSSAPAFFAVGLQSEPALANLTVSLATAAAAQNKRVQILFDTSQASNPPGCQANDCRRLISLMMLVGD